MKVQTVKLHIKLTFAVLLMVSIYTTVPRTLGAGITMTSSSGFSASLRFRHLGGAPLTEDNSANSGSSLLVNAAFGYERGALGIQLEVFNLTDSDDRDIAYYY